ncbi:MAG: uracil-DNA glycosylase [Candidatus Woykebacteria bacterium]
MSQTSQLTDLAAAIEICKRCDLYKSATHAVPGEGNFETKVVFIGEAPGFHEDVQGRPFVGNAGKLLNLLLTKVGLRREDVFITNVIKHRPPENRDPAPSEIAACTFWLEQQLAVISPKLVVTLGKWSLNYFLPNKKISDVHGKVFRVGGRTILPMYHPAAALRSGKIGQDLENDFLKNKDLLQNPDKPLDLGETKSEEGQGSLF